MEDKALGSEEAGCRLVVAVKELMTISDSFMITVFMWPELGDAVAPSTSGKRWTSLG